MQQNRCIAPGTVWLVGAGPGHPDLLTRKAERLLRDADVVFFDALVGPGVLDLIPPRVEVVPVGKRSGRHSHAQGSINELLIAAARAGRRVVRLKGGDPSVFGRSGEEIAALRAAGVPAFVCPGVTAASAAAATAQVSLTLRGASPRLQFVTAHAQDNRPLDLDWDALADPNATLAIYMGRSAAPEIARELMSHGLAADTPVMIAMNVSLADERVLITQLSLLPTLCAAIGERDPTMIIIGNAIRGATCRDAIAKAGGVETSLPALAVSRSGRL